MIFYGSLIFVTFIIECVWAGVDLLDPFEVEIIHYNDFHAKFEQDCEKDCVGGFPRLYHCIRTLLSRNPDALLLNAGDSFQGTYWYTLFKWNVTLQFMNMLPHDAHALGNHELDDGPEGLVPYLQGLNSPMLVANMDASEEPTLQGLYKPSIVVERSGRKIGIIGVISLETLIYANTGNIIFTDPGEAAEREAKALMLQGVNIIILLSHCGLKVDKEIARVHGKYIDVIVGGHSHSLLWNGKKAPHGHYVSGSYPLFVRSETDGERHQVMIVQVFAYSRYIGDLTVYFDDNGNALMWDGGPVFLNEEIPEDSRVKNLLEPYAKEVNAAKMLPVGESLVNFITYDNGECALGNLMADAMVEYAKEYFNPEIHYLAFVKVGSYMIGMSKGIITQNDLFYTCPYLEPILHFELKGKYLRYVLEEAVKGHQQLQQVSGLQVRYNMSRPEGRRVSEILIMFEKSKVPMKNNTYYHVLTSKYALYFGLGFPAVRKRMRNKTVIGRDRVILESYIRKHSPLSKTLGFARPGRIIIDQ